MFTAATSFHVNRLSLGSACEWRHTSRAPLGSRTYAISSLGRPERYVKSLASNQKSVLSEAKRGNEVGNNFHFNNTGYLAKLGHGCKQYNPFFFTSVCRWPGIFHSSVFYNYTKIQRKRNVFAYMICVTHTCIDMRMVFKS